MLSQITINPKLRLFMRKAGVIKILKKVLSKRNSTYEERFSNALLASINEGDVVWDVGANIGYYTCKFAHAVGSTGKVVAFEPVKSTYLRMVTAYERENLSNVLPIQCALGSCEEQIDIAVTTENNGETNSLAKKSDGCNSSESIIVKRGDMLIAEGIPAPTVIKIDVEAYEEEVLFGLRNYLLCGNLRVHGGGVNPLKSIFCEVHFEQLAMRGSTNAPSRIKSLLEDAGYTIRWLDTSHFQATLKR